MTLAKVKEKWRRRNGEREIEVVALKRKAIVVELWGSRELEEVHQWGQKSTMALEIQKRKVNKKKESEYIEGLIL